MKKAGLILQELRTHLPFTLLGTAASFLCLTALQGIFVNAFTWDREAVFERTFHLFHFAHIFVSAIASAAIFYRHERRVLKTLAVAFLSTYIFCGASDIVLPFMGGWVLGLKVHFHFCLLEEPLGVLLAGLAGIWLGILIEVRLGKISYISHAVHVFISSMASLFYLVSFASGSWQEAVLRAFFITVVAVVIPCCSSDIVFPLSLVSGMHGHEHEDEHTANH